MQIDPAVGLTGQAYEAFGDNPMNVQDPLGLCNGPDGICINQSNGVMNLNSSMVGSDHVAPGTNLVQVVNCVPPTPQNRAAAAQQQLAAAAANQAATVFRAAAEKEAWARFFANPDNAVCDGTTLNGNGGEPTDSEGTCSWESIVKGGGFVGCVIGSGGGSCFDQWNPIDQPVRVSNLQGAGTDWKVLGLSFLSGCWEGVVAAVESSPLGQVGACLAGGTIEAGIDAGGSKWITGQY